VDDDKLEELQIISLAGEDLDLSEYEDTPEE
jgi:hypothetical protein